MRTCLLTLLLSLASFVVPIAARAQPVPATDPIPRVAFPQTNAGNITTIGPRTADAANAAKFSFGVAANGAVFANTADRVPTPGGSSIPVGVNGQIAKPTVAAALGRFMRKVYWPLAVGDALYDLGQELGFTPTHNGTGNTWSRTQTIDEFRYNSTPTPPWVRDYLTGCKQAYPGYTEGRFNSYPNSSTIRIDCRIGTGSWTGQNFVLRKVSETGPTDDAAFADAIAARSSWPSTSALARATVDAIKAGESLQVDPQTLTGPASSPAASSTTHNATNNTTTLRATTHNHVYNGPSVTTTTVTNTSVINNTTQEVISEEETTETPTTPDKPFELLCGLPGMAACNVKVDETGTPDGATLKETTPLETVLNERDEGLETVRDMVDPEDVAWGIIPAWAEDRACSPWHIFTLPEAIGGSEVNVDLCPLMPIGEGIVNFVWAMLGIFAVTSMVSGALSGRPT